MNRALQLSFPGWLDRLVETSIETLRFYEDKKPYFGGFSGGKDSVVIKELAAMAGVKVEWCYSVTTVDPPELVQFIWRYHRDVMWRRPVKPLWRRLPEKGIPTRRTRWCCSEYKEMSTPRDRRLILGVRAEESPRRASSWQTMTRHRRTNDLVIAPILHWRTEHIWQFIRERELPYCSLYDEGWKRLGCVGCPLASIKMRLAEFERWPKYRDGWQQAIYKLWERRAGTRQKNNLEWFGSAMFKSAEEMWRWWISDALLPHDDACQGQLELWA